MSYNIQLQNNNSDLQNILDNINNYNPYASVILRSSSMGDRVWEYIDENGILQTTSGTMLEGVEIKVLKNSLIYYKVDTNIPEPQINTEVDYTVGNIECLYNSGDPNSDIIFIFAIYDSGEINYT